MAGNKSRLDALLLQQGYFDGLKQAQGWIMAGRVVVDGNVISKPGVSINCSANILLRGLNLPYVSRGGLKLEHALQRFGVRVQRAACLDGGASTGGFTDCLLQAGASRVLAVEVGYGQLRGSLACDPRVLSWERTNLGELALARLPFPLDLAVLDLSYLSMRQAVPLTARLFAGPVRIIFLIKPLYEGLAQAAMQDAHALAAVLYDLFSRLVEQGWAPCDACQSPVLGGRGAIEFLALLDSRRPGLSADELLTRAMQDFHRLPARTVEAYLATRPALGGESSPEC